MLSPFQLKKIQTRQEKMVSISFIGLIAVLLILHQAMESSSLNFEDKEQASIFANKRAIAHGDNVLEGRKMMKMKTSEAKQVTNLKSSEIMIEKRNLRGELKLSSSIRNSHPSKSNAMNKSESLSADYRRPDPHPPGHN